FIIRINKNEGAMMQKNQISEPAINSHNNSFIIVLSSNLMGTGDDELGAILIKAFIHTLASVDPAPQKVLCYNSGVKLAIESSGVIDDFKKIEERGGEILLCGTCVNYFEIT